MNHEIYRIANLISEDPDIILEEDEELLVTYTNIYGETKQLSILRAYAITDYHTNVARLYQVVWPNGSIGTLVADNLSPESRAKLESVALPRQEYYRLQSRKRRKKKMVSRHRRNQAKWQYMYETYGRCCPDWFENDHMTGAGTCFQNPGSLDVLRGLDDQADRAAGAVQPPQPQQAQEFQSKVLGVHHSDYGKVQVGLVRPPGGGDPTFKVAMAGEEPRTFATEEEVTEFLRSELDLNL
jgi:hypothetical protein